MTRIRVTTVAQLRDLPNGALLHLPGHERPVLWWRAYARSHQDETTGMWTLPVNPFLQYGVDELEVELPDPADASPTPLSGDESWLSTLNDPHDTTRG